MALPSAVTLGSVAFVVAAGVGLAAVASNASEEPASKQPVARDAAKSDDSAKQKPDQSKDKPKPDKQPSKPEHRRDPVPKVFVEVYNNSGVTGLAAAKARVLDRAGWNVAATDNWYGNIPTNTVYYPARLQDSARALARTLHITRTRPAVSPMQFDRLTVIFTHP